jgi:arylsulfatase A
MNRRTFLERAGTFALGSMTGLATGLAQAPRRPLNFIFILADDLGWTDLNCYGSKYYETPNIDRLASQGMRFTNAHAACPVCSPTRASIMTGRYPARLHLTDWIPGRPQWPEARLVTPEFQQQLPLGEVTIAELLKPAGYVSASIGKWHLGGTGFSPENQGFDLNIAGTFRGSPQSYFGPFDLPGLKDSRPGEYITDRLTAEAVRFIEQSRDRPFFLYLPHFTVHIPLQAKPEMIAKYRPKTHPEQLQHNPTYAAMVESLDQSVGAIMSKVDELGLADHTVIFLNSDNGGVLYNWWDKDNTTSNRPLRAGKGHLYEGGIREPLIVRWPGVTKPGSTSAAPVSSVDYFPTIREIAGPATRGGSPVDGKSLVPLLHGTGTSKRGPLFWHYPHYSPQGGYPGGAVLDGDYKLIEFYEDSHLELYNLAQDLGERNNLAEKEPRKAAELRALLQNWRTSVQASMPKPNPKYNPANSDQHLSGSDPAHQ